MADALDVDARDFFDFKGPVVFRDKRQEAKQRKQYVDAISSEIKTMEVRELVAVYNVVKGLAGRREDS